MSAAIQALQSLVAGAAEYDAQFVARDVVKLGTLGLFVSARQAKLSAAGAGTVFIGTFDASTSARPGIGVLCVGVSTDPQGAVNDAAAQWCLGVLPVLAQGRGGQHSCLVGKTAFEVPTASGPVSFDILKGPFIECGEHDGGDAAAPSPDGYVSLLSEPLRALGLGGRLHWLECYAVRMVDGSVDATCRLDNKDWQVGKLLLMADVSRWPGATPSLHSRRQFLLLLPGGVWPEEPEPRTFWSRLLGRTAAS
jgi:hypothetical protein